MDNDRNTPEIDSDFLEKYVDRKPWGSRTWRWLAVLVVSIIVVYLLRGDIFGKRASQEAIKEAVTFFDISSQWVVKESGGSISGEGILLVPEVHFRIENTGDVDLKYLSIIGVFNFMDIANVRGEGFFILEESILSPGEHSSPVILTSDRGYRGSSVAAFRRNPNWKRASVRLFARSRGGAVVYLDTFYIAQKIRGEDINARLVEEQPPEAQGE